MQGRCHGFLTTLSKFVETDANTLFSRYKIVSMLSLVNWDSETLVVVWIMEFRRCSAHHDVRRVADFAELLERMSDVRRNLVCAGSSGAITTQWQNLPNGANLGTMTGPSHF